MTRLTFLRVLSRAFAFSGVDTKRVELTQEAKIKRLFIDIPRDSYDWHFEGGSVHSAKEYAKSTKDKLKSLGLMDADGELRYKVKDVFWTKEMYETIGKQNRDVLYNMVLNAI